MGRDLSTDLNTILGGAKREHDWTLDLYVGDDEFHLATATLDGFMTPNEDDAFDYANSLENVGEIRQTFTAPIDKVAITIQNKDRVVGQHYAANAAAWRTATCIVGRNYYQRNAAGDRTGLSAWTEMFRGTVQQPNVDDLQVTFDVVPDVVASGEIVAHRNCGGACGFVLGDPKTCAATISDGDVCDHHLKSPNGCPKFNNTHHFGGTEHYQDPDTSGTIPGTGSDTGGDGGGTIGSDPPCPRLDQYVRVLGPDGERMPKLVAKLTLDDWLWNPLMRRFFPVRSREIVSGEDIWRCESEMARGFSSKRHPIIQTFTDASGLAVESMRPGELMLVESTSGTLLARHCDVACPTGEIGDVMRIEIDSDIPAEKIYCYGDTPDGDMIVCHNFKRQPDDGGGVIVLQ